MHTKSMLLVAPYTSIILHSLQLHLRCTNGLLLCLSHLRGNNLLHFHLFFCTYPFSPSIYISPYIHCSLVVALFPCLAY